MKPRFSQTALSILILVSIILTGCAQGQATPAAATQAPPPAAVEPEATDVPAQPAAAPVTLNIMHNYAPDDPHGPVLEQVFKDFMAANPDIKIEAQIYSDLDIPLKVETAFLAGQEPDVVFNNYAISRDTWIDKGVTLQLDDLLKEWGFDGKFLPAALDSSRDKQGRLVAFPFEGFTWPVWYNTDIFEKAGVEVPTTTDELVEAAKKIREAGYEPFTVGGIDWSGYAVFTTIVQLKLSDEEMREVFGKGGFAQNKNAMEGIKLFTELRDAGVFAEHSEGFQADAMNAMFFSEKAAMMQAGSWAYGQLPESMQDHTALAGFPILASGSPHEKPVIYAGFGKGVWVTRNGGQKLDAVRRFVQYVYSAESLTPFIVDTGMPSPLLDLQVDPAKLSPFMLQSTEYVKGVTIVDITDNYVPQKAFDALYKASAGAFIPGATPEDIAAEFDKIYAEQQ